MLRSVATAIEVLIAFQSLLFVGFLLAGRARLRANRYLAGFLLVLALQLISILAIESGASSTVLSSLMAALGMVFGPLLFLYARALLRKDEWSLPLALHFLPASAVLVAALTDLGSGTVFALLNHLSLATYLGLSMVGLFRWRQVAAGTTEIRARREQWILEILVVGIAAFVADVARFWIELGNLTSYREQARVLLFLALLLLVTRVVMKGLAQPEIFRSEGGGGGLEDSPRYVGSSLDAAESHRHAARLVRLLEQERLHLDPELTLDRLAKQMDLSPRSLSQVLNSHLGESFPEIVNRYRIEEFKRLLRDPDRRHDRIIELSIEAGFNSKSTFNEAFKRVTGITPSEYRRRLAGREPD